MNAWLIECVPPVGDVLYFCGDGDWCSNPNHAWWHETKAEADAKCATFVSGAMFRVVEHAWDDYAKARGLPETNPALGQPVHYGPSRGSLRERLGMKPVSDGIVRLTQKGT